MDLRVDKINVVKETLVVTAHGTKKWHTALRVRKHQVGFIVNIGVVQQIYRVWLIEFNSI